MKVHPSLVMSLRYQASALAPALLVLALAILAVSPMSASQASPPLLPDPSLFQPWRTYDVPNVVFWRWLNEDVVYIIADEERQAFLKLRTYEEYESFVEQFWRSRDPTPETRENEFKEEHYRRITVANRLFAYEAVPGWKTDRGMVYIVAGPPDEFEQDPGSNGEPPSEHWTFRHFDAAGSSVEAVFVDQKRTGEFRLVPRAKK